MRTSSCCNFDRLNVMASPARAKLVVFVSDEVARHLSGDLDTLRSSGLLKMFVTGFCRTAQPVTLGYLEGGRPRRVRGTLRHRPR
jgi:DNA replication ATP-dependent helicase Dna2